MQTMNTPNQTPDQIAREWLIKRLEKQFSRYASNWTGTDNSIFIEQMTLLRAFVRGCWPKEPPEPSEALLRGESSKIWFSQQEGALIEMKALDPMIVFELGYACGAKRKPTVAERTV